MRALRARRRGGSEIWGLLCSGVELLVARKCAQGEEVADEPESQGSFPGSQETSLEKSLTAVPAKGTQK